VIRFLRADRHTLDHSHPHLHGDWRGLFCVGRNRIPRFVGGDEKIA